MKNPYAMMEGLSEAQQERAAAFDNKLGETIQTMLLDEIKDDAANGPATLAAAGTALARAMAQTVGAAISGAIMDENRRLTASEEEIDDLIENGRRAAIATFTGFLEQVVERTLDGGGELILKEMSNAR